MKIKLLVYLSVLLSWGTITGCTKSEDNTLTVSIDAIEIAAEGGTDSFAIETNAGSWSITNPANDWITLSASSGTQKSAEIIVTVQTITSELRTATLTIHAGSAAPALLVVTQSATEILYTLSASVSEIEFIGSGSSSTFSVSTTAPQWTIECDKPWLSFDKTTGSGEATSVKATAAGNEGTTARTAKIYIKAGLAPTVEISISQPVQIYPNYNSNPLAPDMTGMTSTAAELASKITIGWNLGNSLEAIGGETNWGNPKTSQTLIDLIKQSGFNSIRIPCSYDGHLMDAETAEINQEWLARIKEVIDYCFNKEMYVVLNIHWDGGWLENNCTEEMQETVNAKQKAFWEQIATYLRDYDEHLLFAGANEPNVSNAAEMAVLNSYSQTFIDAVRSTGGKNAYRTVVIQGPSTDIEKTNNLMKMPTDTVENRLMVEVHYYTPWNFCGLEADADWGKMFFYWGEGYHFAGDPDHNATWGEESTVRSNFGLMKAKFVNKGIPVLLGEFSVTRRSALTGDALTAHLASRAYYLKYVVQQAKAYGLLPFYWDNGGLGNLACGLFNRNNLSVFDQQALDALMQGLQ